MFIPLLILFYFLSPTPEVPKCPPLQQETIPVYKTGEMYGITTDGGVIRFALTTTTFTKLPVRWQPGQMMYAGINNTNATVTIDIITGDALVKVGEKADEKSIEHNKEVKKCRKLWGLEEGKE